MICDVFHHSNHYCVIMLNTLILRMNQSQLPKMDNLAIMGKMPAPKSSVIGKFHFTLIYGLNEFCTL